jgi:hypothetical protein
MVDAFETDEILPSKMPASEAGAIDVYGYPSYQDWVQSP